MAKITKVYVVLLALLPALGTWAQGTDEPEGSSRADSLEQSFTYQTGEIKLKDGSGSLKTPAGFKYLDATQSRRVLVDIWGNPAQAAEGTLGMLLPKDGGVLDSWAFNIEYNDIGYVKDSDADEINYDELLEQMQKESEESNAERTKQGTPPIKLVGWAAKPFYDKERKILHWAKEIKFGTDSTNTLNYNVRVLSRRGVMVLNAIASMDQLPLVQKAVPQVLDIVQFSDGNRYRDFDPKIDNVAAWTIGGLVAGKVLAKVGFFALALKFWKIIALAIFGGGTAAWQWLKSRFSGGNAPSTPAAPEETPAA